MARNDWATERCEKHDMTSCADCLELAHMRRDDDGEIRFQGDCAVDTFREITGVDYDFAVEVMLAVGYRPGAGTPAGQLAEAFASVGMTATRIPLAYDSAPAFSRRGRKFYAEGWAGRQGHAWTILDGIQRRHFFRDRPFKYRLYEVTDAKG